MKLPEDEELQLDEKHLLPVPQRSLPRWRLAVWALAAVHATLLLALLAHSPLQRLVSLVGGQSAAVEYPWPAENEAFEFRLPVFHPNLVHEQLLLQHTFADSWGKPATEPFSPPADTHFNRVVLELNLTVEGVQYDRLAHVFVNGVPVWRTSTAEPGDKLVFSTVDKDVSKYLTLFQQEDSEITLQLDNLVRGRLTGAFNATLSAKYYSVPEEPSDMFHQFITTSKPAQKVTQLIKSNPGRTPLAYYPSDKLELSIPKMSHNTTALKLSLYASGNAAEEFWYSNVIDSEKNHFKDHGHHFLGHGPVRVVNTYVNNILVSVNAPEPIIFTGGISPALWRPIVGVNAFDLKPLEVDLTTFLPELWQNGLSLDVEITNGTQGGSVGSNWIIAANLLSWESDEIETSYGEVEAYTNSSKTNVAHITTDEDKFFQVVTSLQTSEITSNLTYVLKNGTELPLKYHCSSDVKYSNGQQYYSYGDSQFLASGISSTHRSEIELDDEVMGTVMTAHVYPLAVSIFTEPISPPNITFEANVTTVYGSRIVLGAKEVFALESRQNGTSLFTLTPQGNFGSGTTEHVFAAELYPPFPDIKGGAFAKAVNGTLVEFDEKFTFTHHDHHDDSQELDILFMTSDDPFVEHLRDMVLSGSLSFETARDFLIQSQEFKSSVEARTEIMSTAQEDAEERISHFPGFRIDLEQ